LVVGGQDTRAANTTSYCHAMQVTDRTLSLAGLRWRASFPRHYDLTVGAGDILVVFEGY
jgi:hypothetical protein